jgi:hypothetical protein
VGCWRERDGGIGVGAGERREDREWWRGREMGDGEMGLVEEDRGWTWIGGCINKCGKGCELGSKNDGVDGSNQLALVYGKGRSPTCCTDGWMGSIIMGRLATRGDSNPVC